MSKEIIPLIEGGSEAADPRSNEQQLPAVVSPASHTRGTGTNPREIFPQGIVGPAGTAIGPLWVHISQVLKSSGIHRHLPQALLTVIAMVSGHLNAPLALFVKSEPGIDGSNFIHTVSSLIPEGLKVQFGSLNRRTLSQAPSPIAEKAVIAYDVDVPKSRQEIFRSLLQFRRLTSLVALVDPPEPKWLDSLEAMRVTLQSDPEYHRSQLEWQLGPKEDVIQVDMLTKILPKEIGRLRPQSVGVLFLNQIVASLDSRNPLFSRNMAWIQRILQIVTIINHAAYASKQERDAEYYGIPLPSSYSGGASFGHTQRLLPGVSQAAGGGSSQGLMATKVEYYIFYQIARHLFAIEDNRLTPQQLRVFDAIRKTNEKLLNSNTAFIGKVGSQKEFFAILNNQDRLRGWPSIYEIYESVNKDGGMKISNEIIDRELVALLNRLIILNKKNPAPPNQVHYRVNTLDVGRRTELPHPSAIIDPIYRGTEVSVFNLLTGATETI